MFLLKHVCLLYAEMNQSYVVYSILLKNTISNHVEWSLIICERTYERMEAVSMSYILIVVFSDMSQENSISFYKS